MKRQSLALAALISASLSFTGCGVFDKTVGIIVNERDNYLDAQQVEKISVPADLDGDRIADIWEIPDIEEIPAAKFYATAAPRPVSIVGDADPDLIRIQKLGERSWMVVRRKPDTVWPLVRQFLRFHNIDVKSEEPVDGIIVTQPLRITSSDSTSMLHTTIRAANPDASDDDFLVFKVEQGMRRGSSEVHLKYLSHTSQLGHADWSMPSPKSDLTNEILRQLAQFEVDDMVEEAVSRIGQDVAVLPKIVLSRDDLGFPTLRFNVDFERAWATILSAIERSPYGVATKELESRLIELDIDSKKLDRSQRESLGELLIDMEKKAKVDEPISIQILVNPYENSNDIELKRTDGNELTLEVKEHFLVMIQQFAS